MIHTRLSSLVRNLLGRRRVERDLDDEIRSTFDLLVDEQRSAGLSPAAYAGAFEFDLRSAARTFVLQLQFIVTNHPLDQLVPRKHSFAGPFKFGGVLRSNLWSATAGVHEDHFRSMFRTEEHVVVMGSELHGHGCVHGADRAEHRSPGSACILWCGE